jgi:uncharacterized protein (DUF58 family)
MLSKPLLAGAPLDWGQLSPLKFRARTVAEGVFAGGHRSTRRGTGVEFGGHRNYVPGDDLRWLDRRALFRHGKLLVRLFETETERTLSLVLDATRSMAFRSAEAPGAKLAYAAVVAAALTRVVLRGGDVVSLEWLGGHECRPLSSTGGRAAFDRLVEALETADTGESRPLAESELERVIAAVDRRARRGSVIVFLSDLIDLPDGMLEAYAALASKGRIPLVCRVLDPVEKEFPFKGAVRFRASESSVIVETNADQARAAYLQALEESKERWSRSLLPLGGQVIDSVTSDDPVHTVRELLRAAARSGA